MKLKAQVMSSVPQNISGVSNKTGKPYDFWTQDVYVQMENEPFPQRITVNLDKSADAYREGAYIVDLTKCFYIDRMSNIAINMNEAVFIPDSHALKKS